MSVIQFGSNLASLNAQRRLSEVSSQLSKTAEKLSSGLRITHASDDAAGLSISESLKADQRVFNQGVRNLNDGISLLSIADGALETLGNITVRLKELAEQAANGVYGSAQRTALDKEAQVLSKEYLRIAQTTKFNGLALFDGTLGNVSLQGGFGANGGISQGLGGAIGTGSLGTMTQYSQGGLSISGVDSGDLNGDGILDIASVDSQNGRLVIQLGNGDGTFGAQRSYTAGGGTNALALGDFNNDGVLDAAVANTSDDTIQFFSGRGDGTFQNRWSIDINSGAFGNAPDQVALADFNNDGLLDLVSTDVLGGFTVLRNQGNFNFANVYQNTAGGAASGVTTGDLNKDGNADIVTTTINGTSVFYSNGSGAFGTFFNGTFFDGTPLTYSTGVSAQAAIGDVNSDGILDIVTSTYASTGRVLIGSTSGVYSLGQSFQHGSGAYSVDLKDFNGDGLLDIITGDYVDSTISILHGRGNGSFNTRITVSTAGDGADSLAIGDFNADGVLDVAMDLGTANSFGVLLGNAREGVAPIVPFELTSIANARQALPILDRKIQQLANQRGKIGAFESRLQVALNNLGISVENYAEAGSRIKDADVAEEAAKFTRLKILQQSSAAVLAKANLQPRLGLKLLEEN